MPQRVGDWGNGFMPCGEDEGESALASYRCAEAVFPVAGMVRLIPYTKGGLSMVRSLARRLPAEYGGRLTGYGPYGRNMKPS